MKFSIALPNSVRVKALTQPWELGVTGADQTVIAKRVDELGYDMIVVPEHFIVPNSLTFWRLAATAGKTPKP
jgi:alkanesulfonate monooxygenase SsuD/methylene tetrahydromethanopterin reductase-like flavin-dependent oxidoreductase (luciferase family)